MKLIKEGRTETTLADLGLECVFGWHRKVLKQCDEMRNRRRKLFADKVATKERRKRKKEWLKI